MDSTNPEFAKRFDALVAHGQRLIDENFAAHYPNLRPNKLSVEPGGRRYVKIVTTTDAGNGQTSVWAFVDTTNGDVLKPDGWRKPAKHARGNLFDADGGTAHISSYGPAYMVSMPKAS